MLPEPDRTARRSARGPAGRTGPRTPDRRPGRRARTHGGPARARPGRPGLHRAGDRRAGRAPRHQPARRVRDAAREARSSGRPVVELAREVLEGSRRNRGAAPPAVGRAGARRCRGRAACTASRRAPRTAGPDPTGTAHPVGAGRPPRRPARRTAARAGRHRAARRRRRPGRRRAEALRRRGRRPAAGARDGRRSSSRPTGFYRPASLRLEHGRTDPDARYTDWLDAGALTREVLAPRGPGRAGQLPAGAVGPRPRPRRARAAAGHAGRRRAAGARGAAAGRRAGLRRRGAPADVARRRAGGSLRRSRRGSCPPSTATTTRSIPAALADAVVLADHPDRPALVLGGRFVTLERRASGARAELRGVRGSSPATQRSRMWRAIDTGGGRARGPSPARSSSRVNQRASSISSGSSTRRRSAASARATKPSMSDCGNGHGWLRDVADVGDAAARPPRRPRGRRRPRPTPPARRSRRGWRTGPGGHTAWRPSTTRSRAVVDEHDHGRVGAREDARRRWPGRAAPSRPARSSSARRSAG